MALAWNFEKKIPIIFKNYENFMTKLTKSIFLCTLIRNTLMKKIMKFTKIQLTWCIAIWCRQFRWRLCAEKRNILFELILFIKQKSSKNILCPDCLSRANDSSISKYILLKDMIWKKQLQCQSNLIITLMFFLLHHIWMDGKMLQHSTVHRGKCTI